MNWVKEEIAQVTNLEKRSGSLADVLAGADVFIGVSAPGVLTGGMVRAIAKDPILFACANPTPEIFPEEAKAAGAAVMATGRSDYPNQINNVLAFPGIFRGAFDVRASDINDAMKVAAAKALASLIGEDELSRVYHPRRLRPPGEGRGGQGRGRGRPAVRRGPDLTALPTPQLQNPSGAVLPEGFFAPFKLCPFSGGLFLPPSRPSRCSRDSGADPIPSCIFKRSYDTYESPFFLSGSGQSPHRRPSDRLRLLYAPFHALSRSLHARGLGYPRAAPQREPPPLGDSRAGGHSLRPQRRAFFQAHGQAQRTAQRQANRKADGQAHADAGPGRFRGGRRVE